MTQNRPPPAFQEYAAAVMARVEYRVLKLPERGLLYSMRLECWVNRSLPENPEMLAKVLGFDAAEIKAALPAVMPFLAIANGQLICPELEDYRSHLEIVRSKQAEGGKRGAERTNGKRKKGSIEDELGTSGNSRVEPRVLSSVQSSSIQSNQTQPRGRDVSGSEEWLQDYDRASNGG